MKQRNPPIPSSKLATENFQLFAPEKKENNLGRNDLCYCKFVNDINNLKKIYDIFIKEKCPVEIYFVG